MRPSIEDNLERLADDPPGWHVRETVDLEGDPGYPLMGSSPAERYEALERGARIAGQAMRDHLFVGSGVYCEGWSAAARSGSDEAGYVSMRSRCGYGRDTHPVLDAVVAR
jgi:hypothetical protein